MVEDVPKKPQCSSCGDDLEGEEIESPRHDKDGTILCDECFENEYTHRCPVCEGLYDEDLEVRISPKYLLILQSVSEHVNLPTGVYEIIDYPFFRDGMIELEIIKTSVKWICEAPSGIEDNSELYYICDDCAKKAEKDSDTAWNKRWT